MKTYILGFIIAAVLSFGLYSHAEGISDVHIPGVSHLKLVNISNDYLVVKYFDSDNNVVCYAHGNGISCLRN